VALDRSAIQRSDFPTTRRGYDPSAVDAHLREVADRVETMRRPGGPPMAAAASAQVQRIIEAAEATAEQLRSDAGEEAREHVHRVSTAAREMLERIGAMHDELGSLMDRMREDAGRLSSELRALERDVGDVGAEPVVGGAEAGEPTPPVDERGPEDADADREARPDDTVDREPEAALDRAEPAREGAPDGAGSEAQAASDRAEASQESAVHRPESEAQAASDHPAAEANGEPPADRPEDEEAARIVALDMALGGTPREETERYLAEHYSLPDPAGLLDDVYALAGS